jgi:RNA polymerase sigma-70 factor (ECF subfamily)
MPTPTASDEELVASYLATKSADPLDRLINRHLKPVRSLVYRMVLNDADADDVTQDVFLRAIRGLDRYDRRARFASWLYRIAQNASYDLLAQRGRAGANAVLADARAAADPTVAPERVAMTAELLDEVTSAMSRLSPPLRAAVSLVNLQGMSAGEAAQIEGCTAAVMYWRLHRGRRLLGAWLKKHVQ